MLTQPLQSVVRNLRRLAEGDRPEPADGALLRSFLAERDEFAFALLVRRHGPMVLGVCQRVLGNCHDAEDAFQAAFLVLARKAASVQPPELVGPWLHGVAYRTALETRARVIRRRSHEKQVTDMPHPSVETEPDLRELKQRLDHELSRLPDKYRSAVVLCELEGRSRKDAAALLKIAEGTLSSRLAAARKLLADRLTARGLALSAALLAALLAPPTTQAAVPPTLLAAAVKAGVGAAGLSTTVIAIAEGVISTMLLKKLKMIASCALAFCLASAGAALIWTFTLGSGEGAAQTNTKRDSQTNQKTQTETNQTQKDGRPAEKQDAKEKPKTELLPPFSKIHLKQGKAVIRQTGKGSVGIFVGPAPAAKGNADAKVEGDTLVLHGLTPAMEFVLEVKDLTELKIDGIGAVEIIDLKGKKLDIAVSKPAKVSLSGSVDDLALQVAAGSLVDASACKAQHADVHVAAGGRAVMNVAGKLKAVVAAGGTLEYLGSPQLETTASPGATIVPHDATKAAPKSDPIPKGQSEAKEPAKDLPVLKGAVTLTATVDGHTQGTMFNMQKYPFKYAGASALTDEQLKSLARPGDVPAATAKALLACLLWPKHDDKLQKAVLKSDGKKLVGEAEVAHKYGKQGTHILKMKIEGAIVDGRLSLQAVNPTVGGAWDWGGGSIKLIGEVKIAISVK